MVDNLTNVYAKFILREEEIPTGCAIVCCFETLNTYPSAAGFQVDFFKSFKKMNS